MYWSKRKNLWRNVGVLNMSEHLKKVLKSCPESCVDFGALVFDKAALEDADYHQDNHDVAYNLVCHDFLFLFLLHSPGVNNDYHKSQ
jgi:hypothetical protein